MDTTKGRNLPGEDDGSYKDMPVRPAPGGHGATAADIRRGYSIIPNVDTDGRTGNFPERDTLTRNKDGI